MKGAPHTNVDVSSSTGELAQRLNILTAWVGILIVSNIFILICLVWGMR